MSKNPSDAPVGYKRPPIHSQFRPGCSGNPSGRPRGVKTLQAHLRDALDELVVVHKGGCDVEVTKARAVAERFITSALGGDVRAIVALFAECARKCDTEGDESEPSPAESEIVEDFRTEEQRRLGHTETDKTTSDENMESNDEQ